MGMAFNSINSNSLGQLVSRLGARVQAGGGLSKPAVTQVPSPNHNDRPGGGKDISAIVLHHTAGGTLDSVANFFKNSSAQVSSHYIVGKDGRIVQSVQDDKRSWHAGTSEFKGRNDVNDFSLGIEIVNDGNGRDPFPESQYKAVIDLVAWMCQTYNVPVDRITGHKDVALPRGRKNDPAPNFDWNRVRSGVEAKLKGASAPAQPPKPAAPAQPAKPAAPAQPAKPAAPAQPALQTVPIGSLDSLTLSGAAQAQYNQPLTEVPLGAIPMPGQVFQPAVQMPQPAVQVAQPAMQPTFAPAVQPTYAPPVQPTYAQPVQPIQSGAVQPRFAAAVVPRFAG
ncbi:N-acetylmuramoyl-L-alanine amidase [bacterium]|nr:N-acetylmuramoyl-L-alanine amidase [bacterium]